MKLIEKKEINIKGYIKPFIIITVIALCLEIFLFNFRAFETLFNKPVEVDMDTVEVLGMERDGDMYYLRDETCELQIHDINSRVRTIRLDYELPMSIDIPIDESGIVDITVWATDEGNAYELPVALRKLSKGCERSQYINFDTSGVCKDLFIAHHMKFGKTIKINRIILNAKQPFEFNLIRFVILYCVTFIFFMLRKKSRMWEIGHDKTTGIYKLPKYLVFFGLLIAISAVMYQNHSIGLIGSFEPYSMLAEGFADGHTYVNVEPSKELMELSNPYDNGLRTSKNVDRLWDFAYFDGKYYVYFGAVPCVLFYLPFFLLTGLKLPTTIVITIAIILSLIGLNMLLKEICKKWYPDTNAALYFIIYAVCACGQLFFFMGNQPDDYEVPILVGLMFTMWGLYLWLSSRDDKEHKLTLWRVITGSLCMALVAGCRPTMAIYSILALFIFGDYFKVNENYKAKIRNINVGLAMVPYLVVGILLMAYNHVRFGSPFDFGVEYNITIMDMSSIEPTFEKAFYGIYKYLFEKVPYKGSFPFVDMEFIDGKMNTFDKFYIEVTPGGLISANLILILGIFVFLFRKELKAKKLWGIICGLIVSAIFLVIFDSEFVGVVYRYYMDFALAFFLIMSIGIFQFADSCKSEKAYSCVMSLIMLFAVISIFFNVGTLTMYSYRTPLINGNTDLYYQIYYAFNFWM